MSIKSGLEVIGIKGDFEIKNEKLLRKYGYGIGKTYRTKLIHLEKLISLLDELNQGVKDPIVMNNCKYDKWIRKQYEKKDFEFLKEVKVLVKEFNPSSYSKF
ncbi:hypothetical protein [Clostridium botulinum]|uniref:hypothetical protein n=1 Tax=Clostridium botulinum TaxID=1491 RepID=UPI000772D50D|nr:hypothetical protein [Clostridium botulinum]NFE96155.1 hypothetical protein [Clostridium botulinum]NFL39640.1 hypothetical protein [Clostridium botulinum]NFL67219.1 hypothetical protein [Clostridium botulinum]NFN09528.1 hypothetical protein [Clostridium botulinum]NFN26780.1 hypothetical protein [Clostridium botulinum]